MAEGQKRNLDNIGKDETIAVLIVKNGGYTEIKMKEELQLADPKEMHLVWLLEAIEAMVSELKDFGPYKIQKAIYDAKVGGRSLSRTVS